MNVLRYNTSATVKLGPFVSSADGYTEQTSLTLSQSDIRLSKNGGDFAQKDETSSGTHDENGWYDVNLSASDIDTMGRLDIAVSEGGTLPVWATFMVMSEQEYDALYGDETLRADLREIQGVSTSANDATLSLRNLSIINDNSTSAALHIQHTSTQEGVYIKGDTNSPGLRIDPGSGPGLPKGIYVGGIDVAGDFDITGGFLVGDGIQASATNLDEVSNEANLKYIDDISLSGHDAVLRLKQLSLQSNDAAIPLRVEATNFNDAVYIKGFGTGHGINVLGGSTAAAVNLYGGTNGLKIESLGANDAVYISSPLRGIYVEGDKGGVYVKALSQGHGLGLSGHPGTGHGLDIYGDAGIVAKGVAGLGYGMVLSGMGAGQAGLLTNGAEGLVASATNLDEVTCDVDLSEVATSAALESVASDVTTIDGKVDIIDGVVDNIYKDMATSAVLDNVSAAVSEIPTDNNGITVSANNLDEVDISGQSVVASASNLDEVDISGQSVSANNLDEVDISGQSVSANNLDEINIVSVSASNLDEVDISGQAVSANNLDEIDITGQYVVASASNLDEVDISGQAVSANNLDEIDIDLTPLATSAALQVVDNNVDTIVSVLPPADIIAGKNDIDAILVNTRFKATVPNQAIVPESGYYPYELVAHLYNSSGSMEDPDNDKIYVQIKAVSGTVYKNELYDDVATTTPATSGTNVNFQPEYYEMVKVNTGYYHLFYKLSASEVNNQWVATFGYEENGEVLYNSRTTIILEQTPGVTTLADNNTNKDIIRESMGRVDGVEASIDDKLNNIYSDMGTSARQVTINTNILETSAAVDQIPTDNNGINVSATNLNEVDISGQSVSASNLDEVDISGQSVSANNLDEINIVSVSASNLDEVDISGQSVSANNLDEINIVSVSANNLDEVDISGQSVSANNLDEVDVSGQFVVASASNLDEIVSVSANNLDEVDISGQSVSANNLDEINITGQFVVASASNLDEVDISGQSVSANNLDEINVSADCANALVDLGIQTSAYADIIKDELLTEINDVANEVLLSATIDGNKSVTDVLSDLLAEAIGQIVFTSALDLFTYYRQNNSTSAFALSGVDDLRTRID